MPILTKLITLSLLIQKILYYIYIILKIYTKILKHTKNNATVKPKTNAKKQQKER